MALRTTSVFVCPVSHTQLTLQKNILFCKKCNKKYRIKNGIPLLISALSSDVELSESRWDGLHTENKKTIDSTYSINTVNSYIKFLETYKKDFSTGYFLDLGCGISHASLALAKKGVKTIGTDISFDALAISQNLFKKSKKQGIFAQADVLSLPFKDNTIRFIYSCMSLEYVKDTQKALDECFRVLEPKGKIVAILPVVSLTTLTYHQLRGDIPNVPGLKNIMEFIHINVLKGKYMHYGYEQSFTVTSLRNSFIKSGFTIKKINFFDTNYSLEFIPASIRENVKKLLKHRIFWPLVYVEAVKK